MSVISIGALQIPTSDTALVLDVHISKRSLSVKILTLANAGTNIPPHE
jgi:hypothetical protein